MNKEPQTKNPEQRPTVAFKTVGCRLNQAETTNIAGSFRQAGYRIVDYGTRADVVVIHTCTITQNAERKCLQAARAIKRQTPECLLVLIGCAVETDPDGIRQRSGADLVAGQDDKYRIHERVSQHLSAQVPHRPVAHSLARPFAPRTRTLIKIQDGCDFRCAYCIVPDARGKPKSLPHTQVREDVQRAADAGYREVVLTGANLGCYNDEHVGLVDLLEMLEKIQGLERIRLSSIEMSTVEREVIDFMAASAKLCHMLHLPLQTGDDRLLHAMGRHYTTSQYRELVSYASERIPRLGLGTDLLVGLPGETEAAFNNTLRMVKELPFSNLHIFPYSRRPGTPAAEMNAQVPSPLKKERCTLLKRTGDHKRMAFAEQLINRPVSVLVESIADGIGTGWTSEYIQAHISQPGIKPNDIVTVEPTAARGGELFA